MVKHPLVKFVGRVATPFKQEGDVPIYDPKTQLQVNWNDIQDHLEILCSGKTTGDPDTRSATTDNVLDHSRSDDDTDDSGT